MDPPFSGFVLDPSKCSQLSIEEKRELVRELTKWPESALEKLQTWTRHDLSDILCAEIGKERKYTSLTKQKMINCLLRVVSQKKSGENANKRDSSQIPSTPSPQTTAKRQRKSENPTRLPIVTNNLQINNVEEAPENLRYCQNSACRATLNMEDSFCKRCSCCICYKYDDNKDPSLWLFCSAETLSQGESCGMSCHLECALKHESTGMMNSDTCTKLDGRYYCVQCRKSNDLLGCWKKQLVIAKYARRVDVLCYRISLSHKLLSSTEKYQSLHEIVDQAWKKLESEVGPIDDLENMARGIVNRLSVGAEVQKLCASAVDLLDSMRSDAQSTHSRVHQIASVSSSFIRFEQTSPTSLTVVFDIENDSPLTKELVGFNLWLRLANSPAYPEEPSFSVCNPKRRLLITEIAPNIEYMFKIEAFSITNDLGTWEIGVKTQGNPVVDNSVDVALETDVSGSHCQSPKATSSALSNPSEGDESNTNSTTCADLNKLPEMDFDDFEKPEIVETERSSDRTEKDTNQQKTECKGIISGGEAIVPEMTLGHSESAIDEEPNSTICTDSTKSMENNQASEVLKSENESNNPVGNTIAIVPFGKLDSTLPAALCRAETGTDGSGRCNKGKSKVDIFENGSTKPDKEPGSSSKERQFDVVNLSDSSLEGTYESCVKVIRWLECEGHIETSFRVKFLTWFSLRATPQERRVVSVYVDTLIEDPPSLAGQLVDTFSEAIYSKRPPPMPNGFCMKLWH
ncbi:VIN3-like protein 2 isoform X1 [Zingiber officinale]|uniref:VIN3-like protein 2 isoform X1 n=1 Tax=Zingiber officinale TaxID=94328 RepID=UPI001C4CBAE4|nr:VIN3-like protein 2 isoform X1 [Zingiber officinale]